MLTFKEYKYERPDMDYLVDQFQKLITRFNECQSVDLQYELIKGINELRNNFETMCELVEIRHTINTFDEFYEKENEYFDNSKPIYQSLISKYYKALINSKYKSELENKLGKQLFTLANLQLKTFKEEIITDLQEENKLVSSYGKLIASAKILFDGEERTLPGMVPFMQSKVEKREKQHGKPIVISSLRMRVNLTIYMIH